jgi:NAD(P)H-nitrite reductase large subunit
VGCELAEALKEVGHPSVSLLEMAPHPLPLQLEEVTGTRLRELMQQHGVAMYCGDGVTAVERNADGTPAAVHLKSGLRLPADLIVAAQVRKHRTATTRAECNRGIVIDEVAVPACRISTRRRRHRMPRRDPGSVMSAPSAGGTQTSVAGINGRRMGSAGTYRPARLGVLFGARWYRGRGIQPTRPGKRVYDHTDSRGRLCGKVCYTDNDGVLKAAILWGDVSQAGLYGEAVVNRRRLGDLASSMVPGYRLQAVA